MDVSSDEVEPRSTRSVASPVPASRSPRPLTTTLVNVCSLSLDFPRTTKRLSSSSTTNSNPRRKGGYNPFKRRRVTRSKRSAYLVKNPCGKSSEWNRGVLNLDYPLSSFDYPYLLSSPPFLFLSHFHPL